MTSTVFYQIQCFILLQLLSENHVKSQLFILTVDYNYQSVTNDVGQNVYADPCPFQGIVIESLQIIVAKKCSESGFKHLLNSTDLNEKEKRLVRYIQKECVGRPQCELQETWKIRPTLKCNGSLIPIDTIGIKGKCLQTNIDNETVFDLQQIQKLDLLHNIFIISQSREINRICQLSGHGGIIKITFLLVDFDTIESENATQYFSIINDSDTDDFRCLNPQSMTNVIQQANTSVENATIDVFMNNGFLWMQIEAYNTASLVCKEHNLRTSSCFKPTDYEVSINTRLGSIPSRLGFLPIIASLIVSLIVFLIIGFLVFLIVLMSLAIHKKRTNRTMSRRTLAQNETHVYNITTPNIDNHVYTDAIVNERDTSIYTNASVNQRETHTYNLTADGQRDSHIYNPVIIVTPQSHTYSAVLQTDGAESGYTEVSYLNVEPDYMFVK